MLDYDVDGDLDPIGFYAARNRRWPDRHRHDAEPASARLGFTIGG